MKTIRKAIGFGIATSLSIAGFSQVNLGLQSTTQAALRTTASTVAIVNTTNAASAATKSTLQTTVANTSALKTQAISTVDASGKQTAGVAKTTVDKVKDKTAIQAGSAVQLQSQQNTNTATTSGDHTITSGLYSAIDVNGEAGAAVNGSQVIDKAGSGVTSVTDKVENTTGAAVNKAKAVKAEAAGKVKATAADAKAKAAAVKPEVAAEASSTSQANVSKQ